VLLSCAFLLGWVLSWMYYVTATDEASSDAGASITQPYPSTTDAPSISAQSGENPSPESDTATQTTNTVAVLSITRDRLKKGEFEAVMDDYADLQSQLSAPDAIAHRKIIIDHARALLESGQPVIARALLALYLQQEYRDVSALLLMARIRQATGNEMEALEVLFRARSYAYAPGLIEQTDQAIRSAVRQYDAQLSARKDYIAQLNLYRRLTELEPEYSLHFIGLAETYLALGNVVDARKALELTRHDASVSDKVNDIVRRIETLVEPDRYYAAEISLQVLGNQFLVDARLNDTLDAVLLLDTGASLSVISSELVAALGIANQPTGRMAWFSTAGGRIKAPMVQLQSLALDGVVVEIVEVGVIGEFDNNPFDGLLGMDFLRHFEFFIDQNSNTLKLNPRG
jgi:clan AA aspartic protease (TIGR02281 family)